MRKFKFRPLRSSQQVYIYFDRPIFQWQPVPERFFAAIYESVGKRFGVHPGDFSVEPGSNLGEVKARYSFIGGSNAVVLQPDRLSIEFSNLLPVDVPVVLEVMATVHDILPNAFPELTFSRIDVHRYEHLDLLDAATVHDFLEQFRLAVVDAAFQDLISAGEAINRPGATFSVATQQWDCNVTIEQSLMTATGVFIKVVTRLRGVSPSTSFNDKLELTRSMGQRLLNAVGLEDIDATG